MQVKDIMTTRTTCIAADAAVRTAAETMKAEDIGFLPVFDGGQIVGVVTDRDLALRTADGSKGYDAATVADVMTPSAHAIRSDAPLATAAVAMKQKDVRRLLVLDENANLAGVVSLGDLAERSADVELACAVMRHMARSRSPDARASVANRG